MFYIEQTNVNIPETKKSKKICELEDLLHDIYFGYVVSRRDNNILLKTLCLYNK